MLDGKKTVAQTIVYDAFDIIKEKEQKEITEKTCPYCFSNINIKAVKMS